jgi:hypothetical protein
MDVAGMGNRDVRLLDQAGQSTVEYLLLLAVVITISYTIISSQRFRDLLGREGRFAREMKAETEWNYRHGFRGRADAAPIKYPGATHPTYWNGTTSRFIGPLRPYPQ